MLRPTADIDKRQLCRSPSRATDEKNKAWLDLAHYPTAVLKNYYRTVKLSESLKRMRHPNGA
ncbi:hypothetical protein DAPPUDRAFT_238133 [Daphnia pulex]|uniref:Uncharacterized protein n=1 Tax=Daphnia pulex TaxID=6669 RepID=E9G6Q5_DAPPU|nr:hypothetical protein DAPPUDRAFT_238133 [Daphnia pulex]|eukprot:EFX85151.1 hypothetical protein DAPPUDRAFT_238133 [Daphnia pulex]